MKIDCCFSLDKESSDISISLEQSEFEKDRETKLQQFVVSLQEVQLKLI